MTTRRPAYREVPQDPANLQRSPAGPAARSTRNEQLEWINNKIHAFLWVSGAVITLIYTDFFNVLMNSAEVDRFFLGISMICLGVVIFIALYLVVYLPYIKKVDLEWNVSSPRLIPAATIFGVMFSLTFIIACWPVWGFLTPLIAAVLFVGLLMSAHFLPSF